MTEKPHFVAELYEVREGKQDLRVVVVDANSREDAEREIQHYAMMYGQDGPVRIKRRYK